MRSSILRFALSSAALVVLSGGVPASRGYAQSGSPIFQMRLASDLPRPDHDRMTVVPDGHAFYVRRTNVVADDGIADITVTRNKGDLMLDVTFTPDGARRLSDATRDNVGEWMALILDSKPIVVSQITSQVGLHGRLLISAQLSPEVATELKEKVAAKWPRTSKGSVPLR